MCKNTIVDSEVPFGRTLSAKLHVNDLDLEQYVRHDAIERRYLAWETVRKELNPYFTVGTGFEGYLIGQCPDAEAALNEILAMSQDILDAIARLYRFEYNFRSRLEKTLLRESDDPEAIHIWSSYLGAELAKLHAGMLSDKDAQTFRDQTYRIVKTLPPMVYHETGEDLTQTYAVRSEGKQTSVSKVDVLLPLLKPDQQDAWLVAQNIGEFGHPLVRKLLDQA